MPNSIHVQQADSIVTELNDAGRSWTGQFTATRTWLPLYTGPQLESLRVAVVPMTLIGERIARPGSKNSWRFGPVITLQKSIDVKASGADAAIDALDKLAQDIQDFYLDGHEPLSGYPVFFAQRPDVFSFEMLARGLWTTDINLDLMGKR